MIERGGIARLALKPGTGGLALRRGRYHLEGDLTMKRRVVGEVDRTRAAAAQQTFDPVAADVSA